MTKALRPTVLAALVIAVLAAGVWVHTDSYETEQAEFEYTCAMIDAGAWPAEVEPACAGRED